MEKTQEIGLYLFAVIAASLAGGLLPLLRKFKDGLLESVLSFGAGTLLGAAFFHMIPETYQHIGELSGVAIVTGFLLLYSIGKFWMVHPCEEKECDFHRLGVAAFIGISIHSLLDGMALGSAALAVGLTGAVFLAIIVHKMPAAFSLSGILMLGQYSRRSIVLLILLFSITTPLGALLSMGLLKNLPPVSLHFAIGVAAGTFISIAISDLLPQVHQARSGRVLNLTLLFGAIALMGLGRMLVVH